MAARNGRYIEATKREFGKMSVARQREKKTIDDGQVKIIRMVKAFPLGKLRVWPKNPRKNDLAVEAVERSLLRFGRVAPIIADEKGRICAGETRYKAASKAGIKTFPVIVCRFPDEGAFIGYNIADNQTASIAEWDLPELEGLVAGLPAFDVDLSDIGFSEESLKDLLATNELPPDASGKEFDESAGKDVPMIKCPECGYEFPK